MGNLQLSAQLIGLAALIGQPAFAAETATYSYDALGRLSATTMSGTINSGQTTIVNFDAAGNRTCLSTSVASSTAPTLSICDAWVTEGGLLTFVVSRKGNLTTAVGVHWAVTAGTATGGASGTTGTDFQTGSGDLAFAAGETSKLLKVITYQDSTVEPNETLTVTLSSPTGTSPSGNAVVGDGTATGWILNND